MPPESSPSEPVAAWNRWLSESERQWNAFFNATMETPQFAARLGESLDAYLGLAAVGQQFGAPALIASNLPTRSDVQELNDRLITLDGRLARIEICLAELAAKRNGRTNVPPRRSADHPEVRLEGGAAGGVRTAAARSPFARRRSNGA